MNNQQHNYYEGTPEKHLSVNSNELDTDAINCAILRAQSLVALLHSQFTNGNKIEKVTDRILVDALWGITGYLDQIKILTKNQ